jgi:hypothetical protein
MKQTSVDWLIQNIEALGDAGYAPEEAVKILGKKARTMNKDEITDAHIEGQRVFDKQDHTQWTADKAEQYYNETYK